MPRRLCILLLGLFGADCAGPPRLASEPEQAVAELSAPNGGPMSGTLRFEQLGESSVRIHGTFRGLEPGHTYALHIHSEFDCQPTREPGDDFDPFDSRQHGPPATDPGARHAGDLPAVTADAAGGAEYTVNAAKGLSLRHVLYSIMGRAVVVHQGPDDFVSQPHGGAGERAACGVVKMDRVEYLEEPPKNPP